ncbi:hypothetical protein PG995_014519 [Apiospora arundinis]
MNKFLLAALLLAANASALAVPRGDAIGDDEVLHLHGNQPSSQQDQAKQVDITPTHDTRDVGGSQPAAAAADNNDPAAAASLCQYSPTRNPK